MARMNTWDQRRLAAASMNPGATFRHHETIKNESCAGAYTPQRNCTGPCRRRRSLGQFTGANTMCNQCVRRTPKGINP
ncbi:hypothetical protein ACSUZJ_07295 [Telluria sp. B2]